jgi:hypothetical protein
MKPDPGEFPFLFVQHGTPDADSVGKCEEVFLWFRAPVAPADRARIAARVPSPLQHFWHWDREFCYFGSEGDSYEFAVLHDYTPEPVRTALRAADPARDPKAWHRAFQQATARFDEAVAAFAADLDRWLREVHAIAPIAVFWGPDGTPEDDPWHQWSVAAFADVMADRLQQYVPDRDGAKTLGWIRDRCAHTLAIQERVRGGPDDMVAYAAMLQQVPGVDWADGSVLVTDADLMDDVHIGPAGQERFGKAIAARIAGWLAGP